jgi:hypothetical protein
MALGMKDINSISQVFVEYLSMNLGTGGMAQVVENLPGKPTALSSNPSTAKKEKRKEITWV